MLSLNLESWSRRLRQSVNHHGQRRGAEHRSDDHLSNRHNRNMPSQYYGCIAGALILCCALNLGPAAYGTALARQTAPEMPAASPEDWLNPTTASSSSGLVHLLFFWQPENGPLPRQMVKFLNNPPNQLLVTGVIQAPDSYLASDRLKRLIKRHGIQFPVVIDRDGRWQSTYGVPASPFLYVIGKDRRVLRRQPLSAPWEDVEHQIQLALQAPR